MSQDRTSLDFLEDTRDALADIAAFTDGFDEAAFVADRRTSYAVVRALEIIGEATSVSRTRYARAMLPSPGTSWHGSVTGSSMAMIRWIRPLSGQR